MDGTAERYHVNPATGQPNRCEDGEDCRFGGDVFHYPNRHDAQVAWRARQLERGVIASQVVREKQKAEEEATLARFAGKAQGYSKKISWSVVRSVVVKNLSKYVVNFLGVFMAYAVVSGKWLTDDWIHRLLPTVASIVLVALGVWFFLKFVKGGRKAARVVKRRRVARRTSRGGPTRTRPAGDPVTVPPTAS